MPNTPASHMWRPGAARVLVLDAVAVPRGAPARPPSLPSWPAKDPADVLDYQFDIAPALGGDRHGFGGDGISTLDVAISPAEPGDLALASAAADGARAVLWLSGGHAGTIYAVTLTLGTQAGRTLSRSVLLPVLALTVPAAGADQLQTEDGETVQDGSGDPLTVGA